MADSAAKGASSGSAGVQFLPPLTKPAPKRTRQGVVLLTNALGVEKLREALRKLRNGDDAKQ